MRDAGQLLSLYLMNILTKVLLTLSLATPLSALADSGGATDTIESHLSGKPYELNLRLLQEIDPEPLKISSQVLVDDGKAKRLKIFSNGMGFPTGYEIISVEAVAKPNEFLDSTFQSLSKHEDILLLERKESSTLGSYLHYFQRVENNGRPNHVSTNYLFMKGSTFFHVSAANYSAAARGYQSWSARKDDPNAENKAQLLLQALIFK
jgi:hypothetical protein